MSGFDGCVFSRATAHQRGHTCWFDTAIVVLANTESMKRVNNKKDVGLRVFRTSISDEINTHAGLSEFSNKLQKTIHDALGGEVCPAKPTGGQDIFAFLLALLNYTKVANISIRVPSVSNTPRLFDGDPDVTCGTVSLVDIDIYLEEHLARVLNRTNVAADDGVLLVQARGSDSDLGCIKLDCSSAVTVETPHGPFALTLTSLVVSNAGHVMSYGVCRSSKEWVVFDNEFAGSGFGARTFTGDTFELVKEQMYHFPHTYFDPKHGSVQMNPFFKKGIKSSTIFVYDFVNQKKMGRRSARSEPSDTNMIPQPTNAA